MATILTAPIIANLEFAAGTQYFGFTANAAADASTGPRLLFGTGTPNAVVTAPQGSIFMRTNGAAATTTYSNSTGTNVWDAL